MQDVFLRRIEKLVPGAEPKIDKSQTYIPVCEPTLIGNEFNYVKACFDTNWISSVGKYIDEFEAKFAEAVGAKYAVACSNGTTALHLSLATLCIGVGDEVIMPTFTMIATANSIRYTGATPVLVDSEMDTWNIDVTKIEAKITNHTKAIMPVHTYGHPADLDPILELAEKYHLFVIEDAAEAHGAEYKGRKIGSIGDVTTYSFYANKIITTGEGGMITTNNEAIAQKAKVLRGHAFSEVRHFWHQDLGFNFRMTNMQAAVGLGQMENFHQLVDARRENCRQYNEGLKDIPGITLPPEAPWAKNVFWMYSIMIGQEFGCSRDQLREKLAEKGIETRTFFIPIHFQPLYYKNYKERFPNAEELCQRGLYLPSSSSLTREQIQYITNCVKDIHSQNTTSTYVSTNQ